jgi:hypothetical protein
MRSQFWFAVVVVSFVASSMPGYAWAAQRDESQPGVRLIGSSQGIQPADILSLDVSLPPKRQVQPASPANRAPALRDLFFTPEESSRKTKPADSVAIEPWLPGRGSVGVKVEVTW